jgi:hypothetical protein
VMWEERALGGGAHLSPPTRTWRQGRRPTVAAGDGGTVRGRGTGTGLLLLLRH